jgi:cytochrome c
MSFEMNKILGAFLGAMILAMVTGFIAKGLVSPEELAKPVYMVAGVKEATMTAAAAPAGPEPIGPLLASASAAQGKDITHRLCVACHTFDKSEPNRIGPNLYGVFDQPIAEGHGGYAFSSALEAHDKQKWTPELLNEWLSGPQDFAHGTKMTFVGLPKAKDRADVIAYLDSLSDKPAPLAQFETKAAPVKPAAAPAAAKIPAGQPAEKKPAGPGTVPPAPSPAATATPAKGPVAKPATGAGAVSQPNAAAPKQTPANATAVGNPPGAVTSKPAPGTALHPAAPPTTASPPGTQPTNGQ